MAMSGTQIELNRQAEIKALRIRAATVVIFGGLYLLIRAIFG
jgi:hypothetical protein